MNQTNTCSCHTINTEKTIILAWKIVKTAAPDTYLLKIADQRFIGLSRTDKKGEVYWKFRNLTEDNSDYGNNSPSENQFLTTNHETVNQANVNPNP